MMAPSSSQTHKLKARLLQSMCVWGEGAWCVHGVCMVCAWCVVCGRSVCPFLTHTHKHTHKHTHTSTHTHANTHANTNTSTHTHKHTQAHKHKHTSTHTSTRTHKHTLPFSFGSLGTVSNRKAKLIFFYELEVSAKWKGE